MSTFRKRIFWGFFFGRLFLLFVIIFLWAAHAYSSEQAWDLISLISPVFLTYSIAGATYYLNLKKEPTEETYFASPLKATTYAAVYLYPLLCICFLFYFASLSGVDGQFPALKTWLGIAEIMVAGYLGAIIAKLFPSNSDS